jgi:hypothetical protein
MYGYNAVLENQVKVMDCWSFSYFSLFPSPAKRHTNNLEKIMRNRFKKSYKLTKLDILTASSRLLGVTCCQLHLYFIHFAVSCCQALLKIPSNSSTRPQRPHKTSLDQDFLLFSTAPDTIYLDFENLWTQPPNSRSAEPPNNRTAELHPTSPTTAEKKIKPEHRRTVEAPNKHTTKPPNSRTAEQPTSRTAKPPNRRAKPPNRRIAKQPSAENSKKKTSLNLKAC